MMDRKRHRAISSVAEALAEYVDRSFPMILEARPSPDSPFGLESKELPRCANSDAESLLIHSEVAVRFRILAAMDLMGGMASVVQSSASVYSVFAMTRAAIESFAYTAWILEPNIDRACRAYRGALDYAEGPRHTLRNLRDLVERCVSDKDSAMIAAVIRGYEGKLNSICSDLSVARELCVARELSWDLKNDKLPRKRTVIDRILAESCTDRIAGAVNYGYLSGISHSSPADLMELHSGDGMLGNFNVTLDRCLLPVALAIPVMVSVCERFAISWGLPSATFESNRLFEALRSSYRLPGDASAFQQPRWLSAKST